MKVKRWKYQIRPVPNGKPVHDQINEWGNDGWEIVAVLPQNYDSFYMKKEKQEDEE